MSRAGGGLGPGGFGRSGEAIVVGDEAGQLAAHEARQGRLRESIDGSQGAVLGSDEFAPTTDLHVQFLRPAHRGRLRGSGRIVRRGRDVGFMTGELATDRARSWRRPGDAQVRRVRPATDRPTPQ
ncbi:MAG: hypothetical protein H0X22_11955 [Acidimicrobiia bacterium]|nr:hypothetical protein [Acidimicrobiia bacterium]